MKIPVEFNYEGKTYKGVLSAVGGAGNKMFHLMVNNFYCGQLFYTATGWRFSSQNGKLDHLADVFIEALKGYVTT
jgi:hypothetical protein